MRTSAETTLEEWGKAFGLRNLFLKSKGLRLELRLLSRILNSEMVREKLNRGLIVKRVSRDVSEKLLCVLAKKQNELVNLDRRLFSKVEAGLEARRQAFALKKFKQRESGEF